MTRLDVPVSETTTSVVIAAVLGAIVAVTLTLAVAHDRSEATPKPNPIATPAITDPYENCLAASNVPGPAGFAPDVCEPLAQGFEHPVVSLKPEHFGVDGCVTFPARADTDALVYCPRTPPEATP